MPKNHVALLLLKSTLRHRMHNMTYQLEGDYFTSTRILLRFKKIKQHEVWAM